MACEVAERQFVTEVDDVDQRFMLVGVGPDDAYYGSPMLEKWVGRIGKWEYEPYREYDNSLCGTFRFEDDGEKVCFAAAQVVPLRIGAGPGEVWEDADPVSEPPTDPAVGRAIANAFGHAGGPNVGLMTDPWK